MDYSIPNKSIKSHGKQNKDVTFDSVEGQNLMAQQCVQIRIQLTKNRQRVVTYALPKISCQLDH